MLSYTETPIVSVSNRVTQAAGIRLLIKREDLNHPLVSGNKWWKLRYNLSEAQRLGHDTLLTYGGAYSNHIFATAAAANILGMSSIGIIRGEETLPLNETLLAATQFGMALHYWTRHDYGKKHDQSRIQFVHDTYQRAYIIPEGGTNQLAIDGVREFAEMLGSDFDYLCCPVGTGGTLAGIIKGVDQDKRILGFSTLKGPDTLTSEVDRLVPGHNNNWQIVNDYHFGGYGRSTAVLTRFLRDFNTEFGIPLEFVYTGKMMYGMLDLASRGYFARNTTVLAIHTGGIR